VINRKNGEISFTFDLDAFFIKVGWKIGDPEHGLSLLNRCRAGFEDLGAVKEDGYFLDFGFKIFFAESLRD
jgi:hypothetical protein